MDAEDYFTPDGWREFMKWLAGFLDDKGAPTGSARFTATGATVVNRTRSPVALCSPAGMLSTLQPKPETALASSSKVALLSTCRDENVTHRMPSQRARFRVEPLQGLARS